MCKQPNEVTFTLPNWVAEYLDDAKTCKNDIDRMMFVLGAVERNISTATGGPFGAAVFDLESGELISLGVNLVVPAHLSVLHAEVVAISLAQQKLATHDLASKGKFELYSSTEPCAMCLGAVHWSGVKRLVTGARDADARAIGFDEGVKHPAWEAEFAALGFDLKQDVCRDEAAALLRSYRDSGSLIYNSGAHKT